MKPLLRLLIAPAVETGDKDFAASMNALILLMIGVNTLLFVLPLRATLPFDELLLPVLVALAMCAALFWLMRREWTRLVHVLLVGLFWGMTTLGAIFAGGMHAPNVAGYIPVILVTGLLLSTRAGIGMAVLCALAGYALVLAEGSSLLPAPIMQWTSVTIWIANVILYGFIVVLLGSMARTIPTSLNRMRIPAEVVGQGSSEMRFQRIFNDAPIGMALVDLNERPVEVNQALCNILGYSREELLATTIPAITHPADREAEAQHKTATRDGTSASFFMEKRYIHADGHVVWGRLSVSAISDHQGKPLYYIGQLEDITEHKLVVKALEHSQQQLEAFFAQSLDGCFFMMLDEPVRWDVTSDKEALLDYAFYHQRITRINQAMLVQYGATPEQLLGRTPSDFFAHDLLDGRMIWRTLLDQGRLTIETTGRKCDDTPMWIEGEYVCLYDEQGRITGHFGIQRDITNRKQAEEAYRTLIEHSLQGLIIFQDNRIVFANAMMSEISGYTIDELLGAAPGEVFAQIHPEDQAMVRHFMHARLADQPLPSRYEYRIIRKDGKVRWLEARGVRINYRGRPALQGAYIDSTERKRAEENLRKAKQRYRNLFEEAPIMYVITLDQGGQPIIADCNQLFLSTLGYSQEEVLSRPLTDFYTPESRSRTLEGGWYQQALQGHPLSQERQIVARDGRIIETLLHARPEFDSDGQVYGTRAMFVDITERKRAEAEIRQFNAELERRVIERTAQLTVANKELEAFAYSVSHDLRAPLRGIDGFSRILLEDYADRLDNDGQNYLHRICAASQRMSQLIDDLLKLSRVTRTELYHNPVDLTTLAWAVAAELQQTQPERQVEFVIADDMRTEGDMRLLRVVLENLLSNAWKFTLHQPYPIIEFGAVPQPAGSTAYFVRDNGAGFDMAYADKLFGAFQRLHSEQEFPGTGIGLATVQRIVQRHGGRVWAEATIGKGATFYFTLAPHPEAPTEKPPG